MSSDLANIELKVNLSTDFHLELVSADWISKLALQLEHEIAPLKGPFQGVLYSEYSESRFMGPESVVKYRFKVDLQRKIGTRGLSFSNYRFNIEFRPKTSGFIVKPVGSEFHLSNDASAEELIESGVMKKHTGEGHFEKALGDGIENGLGRPLAISLKQPGNFTMVALDKLETLESLEDRLAFEQRGLFVLPVLVETEQLEQLAQECYGKLLNLEEVRLKVLDGQASEAPLDIRPFLRVLSASWVSRQAAG